MDKRSAGRSAQSLSWEVSLRDDSHAQYGLSVLHQQFQENPNDYLKWYLGGKLLFMWKWDNVCNGDAYQYPYDSGTTNRVLDGVLSPAVAMPHL